MTVGAYRDLVAWQRSVALVEAVYRLSAPFPPPERYGLTQQLRRAAVYVASNIAEGHARRSKREYLRFVDIALGSLAEVETHLLIAIRLGFTTEAMASESFVLADATGRLLRGLERALSIPDNRSAAR